MQVHFILYVADQPKSRDFYEVVLGFPPRLDVPGMTEFQLVQGGVLGLMPEAGIYKLLGLVAGAADAARCELYVVMDDPQAAVDRALLAGARMLSPLLDRDWGARVAYLLDLDGHVLAVAGEPVP